MYLGRIVEIGRTADVLHGPRHPYPRSLLAAAPRIGGPRVTKNFILQGEPANPPNVPFGCRFRTRCTLTIQVCAETETQVEFEHHHGVACLCWREQTA
ncbi:oligopeptide/dipeptide ABC transporter ATP-binding protein [Bosea sp. NBC_00550]|uniref:oligopeptide/dipeptide ABC transporter ATP-binding protein n=1 Tax=Bosea sp. NBC_00550 TaxID=2969621 RepID=UPI003FA4105D